MTDFVFNSRYRSMLLAALFFGASLGLASPSFAQSVGLPAPRLLTTTPMGAKVGSQVEVTISGEHIEDADELTFSDRRITTTRKLNATGQPEPNKYVVTVAADCPVGLHEARVMTRLGISSSRAFSVGTLDEAVQTKANTTLATAMELKVNSICNATMTQRAVDHYVFEATKGQRVIVDCATRGIDSKLDAVVIIADAVGRDLLVERRGGVLDFTVPNDGKFVIKVHELTFKGGQPYYYRLAVSELPVGAPIVRLPSTKPVNSFSWPPQGLKEQAELAETEPNNDRTRAQKISLPCDIGGSFFPAADVDVFEFEAKKGDVWWVEVASERFGLPTDPSILVQHVTRTGDAEKATDVAEFSDIPSPVKVSSNGYAYDGPPYNAGTADILGKLEIKEDGLHRLQISDLFGGTRNDPKNVYRLVIRKAAPDFAVVAWAMHMELRNGDRNAVSKPLALRGGATMALEVVAIRRDGFDGDIDLAMEGLPEGVTASGLKIPAGQSRGLMLVTANQNAPRAVGSGTLFGRAIIDGAAVNRPCRLASFAWPIPDSWGEIPSPRLMADVPVSVSGLEFAPITVSPPKEVQTVIAGEKLTIPLLHTRRSEFSGAVLQLRAMGAGFDRTPQFDVSLTADQSQAVLDTAALKVAPGDYLIAFYGGAVAKYRHQPDAVAAAEETHKKVMQELMAIEAEVKKLTEAAKAAATEAKAEADKAVEAATAKQKAATAAVTAAADRLKAATAAAAPRDIVDIVVSEPIAIRVNPAEKK
ncbi:MAG: serine protease [Candidatus Saccharimonas sp.]|nr:serine protease [Planctomycetaceae bacterium]